MDDISTLPRRRNGQVLRENLELDGRRVLDIGCGTGALVRMLVRNGADAVGLECNAGQLEKARAAEKAGGEIYVEGVGQALPFEDGDFDVAIFFNSLHHVPAELMDQAVAEAARVLKAGGFLYVQEPIAAGPYDELVKPVEDEAAVRALAAAALERAAGSGFELLNEAAWIYAERVESFDAMIDDLVRIKPDRRTRVEANLDYLRDGFARLARPSDRGGFELDQPVRMWLFRKNQK